MTKNAVELVVHDKLVSKKKELRGSYLGPMDSPIEIPSKNPVFGLIIKAINKTLIPSKYEYKKMEEELEIAMRLEAKLQRLKKGHGTNMPAHEFIKELGKW